MRWVGKKTLTGGRLEIGRVLIAWRGWAPSFQRLYGKRSLGIGPTRLYGVGPFAVFVTRSDRG